MNGDYLSAFLDETQENLQLMNDYVMAIESGQRDDSIFAALFRAAHTLKGMSATMGFSEMAHLAHSLEGALGVWRQDPTRLGTGELDLLFEGLDGLQHLAREIQANGTEPAGFVGARCQKLDASVSRVPASGDQNGSSVTGTPTGDSRRGRLELRDLEEILRYSWSVGILTGVLTVEIDPSSVMKGPRAILVMRVIEGYADALRSFPDAEQMEAGSYDGRLVFVLAMQEGNPESLQDAIFNLSEVVSVQFDEITEASLQTNSDESPSASDSPVSAVASSGEPTQPGLPGQGHGDRTVRVSIEKLDHLLGLLSEQVMDRTRAEAIAASLGDTSLIETLEHLSRISNDLQDAVMALRMVPVASLFQRFPRMVRDVAKSLGKSVELAMRGLETEFDRTIIDEMGEALVHLLRNAVDHGLEDAAERARIGKPETGTITMSAFSSGQHVYIEVSDDGRGIDRDAVLKRAVRNGLVTADLGATLSDEAVFDLLFQSGFSTAETVSDISGRGVGLDAVKQKVESLGGTVVIRSVQTQGTTFRLRLPLSMAISRALLVRVQGGLFAVPLTNVQEVVRATDHNLERVHDQLCLKTGVDLIPVLDVGDWLYNEPIAAHRPLSLVVAKDDNQTIAIAVDALLGEEEIVQKSIGSFLAHLPWLAGAAVMGNGEIALIWNLGAWLSAAPIVDKRRKGQFEEVEGVG